MVDKRNLEDAFRNLEARLPQAVLKLQQEYAIFKPHLQEIAANMARGAQYVQSIFLPAVWEHLPKVLAVLEGLKNYPEHIRPMVRALVARGWFLSGEMYLNDWALLQQMCEEERFDDIDYWMSEWASEHLDTIVQTASEAFPHRARILEQAAAAHRAELYAAAIPTLLAQVEGMCIEKLGKLFFANKNGAPRTKAKIEKLVGDALSEVLFLPLREPHGLSAGEDTRANFPDAPNRHEILHGTSTDYDTCINSLKAFSLIAYFVTVVAEDERIKALSVEGV